MKTVTRGGSALSAGRNGTARSIEERRATWDGAGVRGGAGASPAGRLRCGARDLRRSRGGAATAAGSRGRRRRRQGMRLDAGEPLRRDGGPGRRPARPRRGVRAAPSVAATRTEIALSTSTAKRTERLPGLPCRRSRRAPRARRRRLERRTAIGASSGSDHADPDLRRSRRKRRRRDDERPGSPGAHRLRALVERRAAPGCTGRSS